MPEEQAVEIKIIQYKVKAGKGDENAALVEAYFTELAELKLDWLRYASFRLDDGVTFVNFSEVKGNYDLADYSPAFVEFVKDLRARCEEVPVHNTASVAGKWNLARLNA